MNQTEIIIRAKPKWQLVDLSEIWRYRELFYVFTWRDLKIRYKQTVLGILWVIFQPVVTMIIFTIFFGRLTKIPSGDLPYSLFVLCGLTFWSFFSGALSHASDSMITNESIIKKVYFPKIILPFSAILTSSVDFVFNFIFLLAYAMFVGFIPKTIGILLIPYGIIITILSAFGLGLFLSSFNVKYRDVRYILPFFIQLFLFITPIIYPLTVVSETNRFIMALNPMSSVVEATRFIFSQNYVIHPELLMISTVSSIIILLLGLFYFRKTERFFADIV